MDGDEDGFGLHSLAIIQILSGSLGSVLNNESDVNKILEDARKMKNFVPNSFISSDLTSYDATSGSSLEEKKEQESPTALTQQRRHE